MMLRTAFALLVILAAVVAGRASEPKAEAGWVPLFNGQDTAGWKLRQERITVTKFVDAQGKPIPGARTARVETRDVVVDAKGRPVSDARVAKINGKDTPVDADGKPLKGLRVVQMGGRTAVVGADGKELEGTRQLRETTANTSGWEVKDGVLYCARPHQGNDLMTVQKFTDFELFVEFQATSNSGVYLQGRYEIQISDSFGVRPTVVQKDGKRVEVFNTRQCGAVYGKVAPSKNAARPAGEWQSFHITFRGARGEPGQVTRKARVTLVWNGEKVIDDAEIDGVTGSALDNKVTEPGPVLLQGDHGRVAFRNLRIRPLPPAP